jgi:helicase associated protein
MAMEVSPSRLRSHGGRSGQYVKEHRTSRLPYSYEIDDFRLGVWVSWHRSEYAKVKLNPSRERQLQRLPGWTWTL